jgi:bifunctional enzyme CysN/CysC
VVEQTRRHAFIASLLGIPHLVVAVNKMDLVDWSRRSSTAWCATSARSATSCRPVRDIAYVPISALRGDNVVERSGEMPWYGGLPLLEHLETVEIEADRNTDDLRFPVQYVIRDGASDYRGYAGQVAGGCCRPGDEVLVLPFRAGDDGRGDRHRTTAPLDEAFAPMSVTVRLADDLDVSRGDLICRPRRPPGAGARPRRDVCWMADAPLRPAGATRSSTPRTPRARSSTRSTIASTSSTRREPAPAELALNDIGRVRLRPPSRWPSTPTRATAPPARSSSSTRRRTTRRRGHDHGGLIRPHPALA